MLTPAGRASVRAAQQVIASIEDDLERRLGTHDYRALQRILAVILTTHSP